jgi:hypothetical protein
MCFSSLRSNKSARLFKAAIITWKIKQQQRWRRKISVVAKRRNEKKNSCCLATKACYDCNLYFSLENHSIVN